MMRSRLARTLAAAAVLVPVGIAAASAPATAQSADIGYTCDWYHGLDIGPTGTADATGRFDTAIPAGDTATAGSDIRIDPSGGSFVLPADFVDAMRTAGRTEFFGYASVTSAWDVDGSPETIGFEVPSVPLPASGPLTIQLVGARNTPVSFDQPGSYTLVAGRFGLVSDDDFSGMGCDVQPDVPAADRAIDTVTVVEATAPPTTTASTAPATTTTSPSAARPALVQTDAAPPTGPSSAALAGLALVVGGGLLAALGVARRRATTRRH